MGAGHIVVGAQRERDAHADCLHTDVRVRGTAHLTSAVQGQRALVEVANGEHQPQAFAQLIRVEGADAGAVASLSCHVDQTATAENAERSAAAASASAALPWWRTPDEVKKPWIMPGYSEYVTATPASASREAYARPSSSSGSYSHVMTSAAGSPSKRAARSGEARGSSPSASERR